jgi:hypothetical protein
MRRVLRDNGLSITMFALFLIFLVAQSIAGWKSNNSDNEQHRQPPESYGEYLTSGAFVEATFENWESEFLQMGAYVVLTALLALFLVSFVLHALGGHAEYNQQQLEHGAATVSLWSFVTSSHFWFQSMQNWQSEFLAVAALIVLSIFLRQRGSPESKPVAAPHAKTGTG